MTKSSEINENRNSGIFRRIFVKFSFRRLKKNAEKTRRWITINFDRAERIFRSVVFVRTGKI